MSKPTPRPAAPAPTSAARPGRDDIKATADVAARFEAARRRMAPPAAAPVWAREGWEED